MDPSPPHIDNIAEFLELILPPGGLSPDRIQDLLDNLPRLTEDQINALEEKDASCPICYTSYRALLAEEEMAVAMDSPAHPIEELGITKLAQSWQCGHMFCRRDISKWINTGQATCPLCRQSLLKPGTTPPPSTNDEEAPYDLEEIQQRWRELTEGIRLAGNIHHNDNNNTDIGGDDIPMPDFSRFGGAVDFLNAVSRSRTEDVDDRAAFSGMYS